MAANKLIQQPDILNLDSLGAFMDAQNDPIASDMGNKEQEKVKAEEQVSPDTVSEEVISSNAQSEVPKSVQEEEHPRKPKVARSRKGKQVNVQPVIEAGSGEWDTMLRYAEFYNDNPDENRITVVLNPEIKRCSMSDFHRAQQGEYPTHAKRQGRYSLICSSFHRVTGQTHYMPSPCEAR